MLHVQLVRANRRMEHRRKTRGDAREKLASRRVTRGSRTAWRNVRWSLPPTEGIQVDLPSRFPRSAFEASRSQKSMPTWHRRELRNTQASSSPGHEGGRDVRLHLTTCGPRPQIDHKCGSSVPDEPRTRSQTVPSTACHLRSLSRCIGTPIMVERFFPSCR